MKKGIENFENWAMIFAVICLVLGLLYRVVCLQDDLAATRHDLVSIEMEYQRLERRAQFYLEEYQDAVDQRTYYYDRLVQIANNNEAALYLEEK